ncbi:MAG TPA: acetamidase/formamidase family protein [Gemmatimonadales bacterium]|nr:acetamidase/formamidase family protein [Gemmatimonadales bacterium]
MSAGRVCGFALAALSCRPQTTATPLEHRLPATPATVAWGYYSAAAAPVLRIASGDVVNVETLITSTPDRLEAAGVARSDVQQSLRDIVSQVTDRGPGGHILTGPIYVDGAERGDVLEVRILDVRLALPYGYNGCRGFLPENCTDPTTRIIPLDRERMIAHFAPGALFEIGDGHAAQGDGEVDHTAIETSLTGRVQLVVRKDLRLAWPRAETPGVFMTMGTDSNLTTATRIAVQEMIDFLASTRGLTKMEAYRLTSVASDVHVTELVDGTVGVHVTIPKTIFKARARSSADRRSRGIWVAGEPWSPARRHTRT